MKFQQLNNDQAREMVNSRQRFAAFREAQKRAHGLRGSMVWAEVKGRDYLLRSYYEGAGRRKQTSLGARSPDTEKIKAEYDRARADANDRLVGLREALARQSAINRAIGLGRVPLSGAKIIRALDQNGLLDRSIRVVGTNAIFAYEAAAGVHIDSALTATTDIDLLLDSRGGVSFVASEDVPDASLLQILRKTDQSFRRSSQAFRAANRDGYLVDLIKPIRDPPWTANPGSVGHDPDDLAAVEIDGLAWLESAPDFEAMVIDERGEPLRIVAPDPRVWAAHKLWVSRREDRARDARQRDEAQAHAVAQLVTAYLTHLRFDREQLRVLPKAVLDAAAPLFEEAKEERR